MAKALAKYGMSCDLGTIMSRQVYWRFVDKFIMPRSIRESNLLIVVTKADVIDFYRAYLSEVVTSVATNLANNDTKLLESNLSLSSAITAELRKVEGANAEHFYMMSAA